MSISNLSSMQYASVKTILSNQSDSQEIKATATEISSVNDTVNPFANVVAEFVKPIEVQTQDRLNELAKYTVAPINQANSALSSVSKSLSGVETTLKESNPGLLTKKWDFTLSDGKIAVTGLDDNQTQKKFLEKLLNSDSGLVKAVSDYYSAISTYYENTSDHTTPTMVKNSTGVGYQKDLSYFYDVKSQINGKIPVMAMMRNSYTYSSNATSFLDIKQITGDGIPQSSSPYDSVIFNAAAYLTPSSEVRYTYNNKIST